MANTKSAIKRIKQNRKRRIRNRHFSGRARAFIRDARKAMDAGDLEEARAAAEKAVSALDKAASKGILHKNNVARRKSRLMSRLVKLEQESS